MWRRVGWKADAVDLVQGVKSDLVQIFTRPRPDRGWTWSNGREPIESVEKFADQKIMHIFAVDYLGPSGFCYHEEQTSFLEGCSFSFSKYHSGGRRTVSKKDYAQITQKK